ncbi:MAG: DUF2306 domain-containing protein [Gammaproteobacteria bacterium]|nr:DUF2306 domain-containing protein [Gammaproteobacteria bacterium]
MLISKRSLWFLMLLFAIGVSGYSVSLFFIPEMGAPFIKERLESGAVATYIHLSSAGIALTLGVFQMSTWLRSRYLKLHRFTGRLYLLAVLLGGLSGLQMATIAQGGLLAKTGFAALAVLWIYTGFMAYSTIRQGNVVGHRNWMMRNFSLTLAGITLRIYLGITLGALQMDFMVVYPYIAWACWLPNLLVAQLFFITKNSALTNRLVPSI